MEFNSVWFAVSAIVGIAFYGFLIWVAWVVVTSIKGIHTELTRIRELLSQRPA